MRSVTYSMSASLDGYIVGPDGSFDWPGFSGEVFRFWIDEIRDVGAHLMGRRLYETMLYWETAGQERSLDDAERELFLRMRDAWISVANRCEFLEVTPEPVPHADGLPSVAGPPSAPFLPLGFSGR